MSDEQECSWSPLTQEEGDTFTEVIHRLADRLGIKLPELPE